jgi:ATP:ADP antiporter, AAA family
MQHPSRSFSITNESPRTGRVTSFFGRLFAVRNVDPRRTIAFGLLYFAVFAALTLLDGVAISLFVKRVGAESLPQYFGVIAVVNLLAVGVYVLFAERFSSVRVFVGLAVGLSMSCLGAWWCLGEDGSGGSLTYGALYAAREMFQALFLLHFGTFLQRFFSRAQLRQVMPLVYAGGRVGGMAGGAVLTHIGASLGLVNLLLIGALVALWVAGGAVALNLRFRPCDDPRDEEAATALRGGVGSTAQDLDRRARESWRGFFDALRRSPFLYWHSLSAVAYIGCRYVLAFQYSTFFETHFASEVELATFLGIYAQIALGLSLVMQLFVVTRLVRWIGVRGAQLGYATAVLAALALNAVHPSLVIAVFGRFVEQELRLGLRNPTNQLALNFLSRPLRVRVRSWNAGVVTPLATMATSLALGMAGTLASAVAVPALGLGVGFAYFVSNRLLNLSYTEKTTARPSRSVSKRSSLAPTYRASASHPGARMLERVPTVRLQAARAA